MKINNKLIAYIVVVTVLLAAFSIVALGVTYPSMPNAKAAASGCDVVIVPEWNDQNAEGEVIAQAWIKAGDELIISFSTESIIFTETGIDAKIDKKTTLSEAEVSLVVWAEVDGIPAYPPNGVTYAKRIQTLEGELNESQWIKLALDTTNANSFNFIAYNTSGGSADKVHNVTIRAAVFTREEMECIDSNGDPAECDVSLTKVSGAFGSRTLVINEVNLKDINYPSCPY